MHYGLALLFGSLFLINNQKKGTVVFFHHIRVTSILLFIHRSCFIVSIPSFSTSQRFRHNLLFAWPLRTGPSQRITHWIRRRLVTSLLRGHHDVDEFSPPLAPVSWRRVLVS